VITDGEQAKQSFATYPIHGLKNVAPDGIPLLFADGHVRNLPRLVGGPFRFRTPADVYLEMAQRYAHVPLKQAVISTSALSLLYPQGGIQGYSRQEYLDALLVEQEGEIRRCLQKGAHLVQIDFTEARLSVKLDPTLRLLDSFIDLNNLLIERFSADQRKRIGVHTCPGGDRRTTHSADVDYAELLPSLFRLQARNFYMQLASEPDRKRVLKIIREHSGDGQRIFVGVIDPLDPRVETPEEVRDRILEAAQYVPLDRLGTTDDCGFAPFSDDTSRTRETAFDKIRARVTGTALAAKILGVE
jgi:5-methyltetrahydropteroyltriglutamate--homocysteine methyltransferase